MAYGVVKWFSERKGCGFAKWLGDDPNLPDVYLPIDQIQPKDLDDRLVVMGARIKFEPTLNQPGKYRAHQVKVIQTPSVGRIVSLNQEQTGGLIKADDGQRFFFAVKSIIDYRGHPLATGLRVHFTIDPQTGQATGVIPTRSNNPQPSIEDNAG